MTTSVMTPFCFVVGITCVLLSTNCYGQGAPRTSTAAPAMTTQAPTTENPQDPTCDYDSECPYCGATYGTLWEKCYIHRCGCYFPGATTAECNFDRQCSAQDCASISQHFKPRCIESNKCKCVYATDQFCIKNGTRIVPPCPGCPKTSMTKACISERCYCV